MYKMIIIRNSLIFLHLLLITLCILVLSGFIHQPRLIPSCNCYHIHLELVNNTKCCDNTSCYAAIDVYEKEPDIEPIRWFIAGLTILICMLNCIYACLFFRGADEQIYTTIGIVALLDSFVFTLGFATFYTIPILEKIC